MRSTSAIDNTFGKPRPRFGPDRIAAGSSLRIRSFKRKRNRCRIADSRRATLDDFEAAGVEIGEIIPQRLGLRAGEAETVAGEEFGEIDKIAAIGVQRIGASALLRREHVEEQVDEFRV